MVSHRHAFQSLDGWRRKLLRETDSALLSGLLHPERHPRIPTVMVGSGQFDSHWAARWWNAVLELEVVNFTVGTDVRDGE
jgi:hypothetical protein